MRLCNLFEKNYKFRFRLMMIFNNTQYGKMELMIIWVEIFRIGITFLNLFQDQPKFKHLSLLSFLFSFFFFWFASKKINLNKYFYNKNQDIFSIKLFSNVWERFARLAWRKYYFQRIISLMILIFMHVIR